VTRLVVHTARVSYGGPDRLDVTRRGRDPLGLAVAPSLRILVPALAKRKAGTETAEDWARYAREYREEMRASYRAHRAAWGELLAREGAVLVCYCNVTAARPWCHRFVLAELLVKCGATYAGDRDLKPENVEVDRG
jgi:uncharacterized protein YeaO (DUF488 family)